MGSTETPTLAVPGSSSDLLDLGRTVWLVTPKLFLALCPCDRGCTFPGALPAGRWMRSGRSRPQGRTSAGSSSISCSV